MRICIAGSNGMIGSIVTRTLKEGGHEVIRLVRQNPAPGEIYWDPDNGGIDAAGLEGFDGIVNLASMTWPMRWSEKAKAAIRANRLATNGLLASTLAGCNHKPEVLICASGMGYYPPSGDAILTEDSPAGTSFLARLQADGEKITMCAAEAGIRVVHLRIPPVLGGPALKRGNMQTGKGRQWMSWIGRDELASIVEFILSTRIVVGPVNPVSPNPLRNAEYASVLSRILGAKSTLRLPDFLVRLLLGEMGEELMLASRRIQPGRLLAAGYRFHFPELEQAVRHELATLESAPVPAAI